MTINGIKQITGLSKVWSLSAKKMDWALKKYGETADSIIVQNSEDGKYVNFVAFVYPNMEVFAMLADEKRVEIEQLQLMVEEEAVIFPNQV